MKRALLWTAVAAFVLAACSSGTPGTREDAAPAPAAGDAAAAATVPPSAAGVPTDPGGAFPAGPGGVTASPEGTDGTVRGKRGVDYGPPGQGVTASAVKVGVWVLNTDAACNATGAVGNTPGGCGNRDHVVEVNALTKWVNAHGGVAGRKLEVVVHESLANNTPYSSQAEAACEAFSSDEKVFLGISEPQHGRPYFAQCMAARGIPVIESGPWPFDGADFKKLFPYIYVPSRPRAERFMRAYIDGLAARGFFQGDVRVGLFRYDSPTHTRVTKDVMLPRLAAHGIRAIEEAVIRTPASVAALGDMNAELGSHILRFKNADVNRVVFFAGTGEFHFFYFRQADSQDFRPRYGLSSYDFLTLSAQNAPASQLEGSVAVGWAPGYDTPREKDPGLNAAAKTCKAAMAQGGVDDPWGGRNIKCDSYFFMKQALDRAPALNVRGLRAAVEALGTGFEPVAALTTRFGLGLYDGPSTWRYLAYQGPCSCFVYTGAGKPF